MLCRVGYRAARDARASDIPARPIMLQDVALCCTILQEVVLVLQIFQRGRSALRETGRAEGGCAACATPRAMPCVEYSEYPGSSSTLQPCRSRVLRVPLLLQYSPAMPCGEYSEYSGFSRTWPSASPLPSHPTHPMRVAPRASAVPRPMVGRAPKAVGVCRRSHAHGHST